MYYTREIRNAENNLAKKPYEKRLHGVLGTDENII
jgi:hypothetical protein